MDLAKWLVDEKNPLTAGCGQPFLGKDIWHRTCRHERGIRTQGELPSHPELLDWLATEFIRSGWGVKAFVHLLVTSEAYLQNSHVTDEMAARDPANRLLARGPRVV